MMKLLSRLNTSDLSGKKILVRVDFNVAVEGGNIVEPFKITAAKPTIKHLISCGAQVTLASHIESVKSFNDIRDQVLVIVGMPVTLLENTRANPGEKTDDDGYARELAAGFDLYVNDAFATAHRAHASVHAITRHLPSYAGLLMEREVAELGKALTAPAAGKVVVLGGAKIETKMLVINNFLDKAEYILPGGDLINQQAVREARDPNVILPSDLVPSTGHAYDIGPKAIEQFVAIIASAQFVIWNGPMGKYEDPAYAAGTKAIAQAASAAPTSIIGGGDTIAAVNALTPGARYTYVSTGGGAMLEFLAGKKLPALEALGYYD